MLPGGSMLRYGHFMWSDEQRVPWIARLYGASGHKPDNHPKVLVLSQAIALCVTDSILYTSFSDIQRYLVSH
jgi:hypothetical protein